MASKDNTEVQENDLAYANSAWGLGVTTKGDPAATDKDGKPLAKSTLKPGEGVVDLARDDVQSWLHGIMANYGPMINRSELEFKNFLNAELEKLKAEKSNLLGVQKD